MSLPLTRAITGVHVVLHVGCLAFDFVGFFLPALSRWLRDKPFRIALHGISVHRALTERRVSTVLHIDTSSLTHTEEVAADPFTSLLLLGAIHTIERIDPLSALCFVC